MISANIDKLLSQQATWNIRIKELNGSKRYKTDREHRQTLKKVHKNYPFIELTPKGCV